MADTSINLSGILDGKPIRSSEERYKALLAEKLLEVVGVERVIEAILALGIPRVIEAVGPERILNELLELMPAEQIQAMLQQHQRESSGR